jgi:predicted small lipoprotein YifL
MRSGLIPGKTWGIMAILFLLLAGCGHKGPLKLPAPKTQIPQAQTASPQIPDPQKPDLPPPQQIN